MEPKNGSEGKSSRYGWIALESDEMGSVYPAVYAKTRWKALRHMRDRKGTNLNMVEVWNVKFQIDETWAYDKGGNLVFMIRPVAKVGK